MKAKIRALGADVLSDDTWNEPGANFDQALREALQASDGVVLVVPEPGSPRANNAFLPSRRGEGAG